MRDNPVFRVTTKILFAPIIIYGLYVQFHGDFGPGGGFQAGVIVAAAFILYAIVFGIKQTLAIAPLKHTMNLAAIGVAIYAGTGVVNILLGGNYLDYNTLADDVTGGQHLGILLVEFGVGVTVAAVMLSLFYAFVGYAPNNKKTGRK